jgi:hypothetical protein
MDITLQSRALKATLVLNPSPLVGVKVPDGTKQVVLVITLPDRTVRAAVNAKGLRRCIAAITDHGPENVAVVLSGRLDANNALLEAGISAMPKAPKTAVE